MTADDDTVWVHYDATTFPFHADCYQWPRVGIDHALLGTEVLHVHCIRDMATCQFKLMGFIGVDAEDQITSVIYMAQQFGPQAEVIMFRGVGFTDDIMEALTAHMMQLGDEPGALSSLITAPWPTNFQRKIMRRAHQIGRYGVEGDFHESTLAYRMKVPVEEMHHHLEILKDLGLMDAM